MGIRSICSGNTVHIRCERDGGYFCCGDGHALQGEGEGIAAREAFRSALVSDPYSVDSHNNLGCVLRDLGELDEAVEELSLAVNLEPRNAAIHLNLALCYQRLGDPKKALSHLRRHLRQDTAHEDVTDIQRLLAELEGQVGHSKEETNP